jgi:hypothetical protein
MRMAAIPLTGRMRSKLGERICVPSIDTDNRRLTKRVLQLRKALDARRRKHATASSCPGRAVAVSASLPDPRAVKAVHTYRDRATPRAPYLGA